MEKSPYMSYIQGISAKQVHSELKIIAEDALAILRFIIDSVYLKKVKKFRNKRSDM